MSMLEWAKREVEIACKRERGDKPEDEWDYGCACYDSALRAFESLLGDGHSGSSIQLTKNILNRLIDGKVLTPIEDTEDIWSDRVDKHDDYMSYQCKRMSSVFKSVYNDGTVNYKDVNRFVGIDPDGGGWHSGLCDAIGYEHFPITFPYMPTDKRYEVHFEELLTDPKNGDFDTEWIKFILTPEGEKVEINRYFREPHEGEEPTYKGWVEINLEEWNERKKLHEERLQAIAKGAENEV